MKHNVFTIATHLSPKIETDESQKSSDLSTAVIKPTLVGKPTQVTNQAQVDNQQSSSHVRRVTEQDSSVALEERASTGLERGYTRIPNCMLMQLVNGDFTRNEIKIALIIARFTISFRRELAPLSKKVLERQSGLRGAAILEAVSGLVAKGLVQKQKGDQYRPNMLGLVLPKDWQGVNQTSKDESLGIDLSSDVQTGVEIQPPASAEKPSQGEIRNPTSFKDTKIYKNKISLSELPVNLQKYLSDLKPAKKRESEWKAFENLSQDYQTNDIADCFNLLMTQGIKGKRGSYQQCHSPMAYLAKAINEVMSEVSRAEKLKSLICEQTVRAGQQRTEQSELRAKQETEFGAMEEAFQKAFPSADQQQAFIDEACRNMPFLASPRVKQICAINDWWSKAAKNNQQQEITN